VIELGSASRFRAAARSASLEVEIMRFVKESVIDASAETVFAFHEAPDAFQRLQPPWQTTKVVQPPSSLEIGTRVVLKVKVGPFWQTIVAEHVAYEPGRMFADRMVKGPFARWLHRHIVTPRGPSQSVLTDDIEYELPLGWLGRLLVGGYARRNLERMFEFRHRVTREACEGNA
jgi:ligand-binding SRPBCC domain-containing protein